MPNNYYEAKRLFSKLGLESEKIDCCVNDCMIFYDNDNGKMMHPCSNANFMGNIDNAQSIQARATKKPIPLKSMFYLPIIPRLQRMFSSMQTT